MATTSTRYGLLLLSCLASFALALGGCQNRGLTKANVDLVSEGMAKKQVESILGMPTSVETKDFIMTKKTTYVYTQGKDTVTVTFKEDRVESKESTLAN